MSLGKILELSFIFSTKITHSICEVGYVLREILELSFIFSRRSSI
jgi:hypothetical protein